MNLQFNFTNKNILVTGGAGFIGSNLCKHLLMAGANVSCLDNLSTGHLKNIQDYDNNKKFKFIEGDIRNLLTCQEVCKDKDYVLHQAALGSVPRSIKDPLTSNDVNITGFLNMLVASRDNNVKRFIFAASSSTYGDSKELPKVEENIGKPLSPYAITKYVNELYADIFSKSYGLKYIGLRYFNVFGENQDPDGAYAAVIPKFIKKLINHESPVINGDGSYSRDFTFIENVILMNFLAIKTEDENAINQIYNTACAEKTDLNELIDLLKLHLSKYDVKISEIKTLNNPIREGDVPHSLASINKAKSLLGYKPSHKINTGLKKAIDWYWKNL